MEIDDDWTMCTRYKSHLGAVVDFSTTLRIGNSVAIALNYA